MAEDDRVRELITEYGHVLTQWEDEFLDSLDQWGGEFTAAQIETLDGIYARATRRW